MRESIDLDNPGNSSVNNATLTMITGATDTSIVPGSLRGLPMVSLQAPTERR